MSIDQNINAVNHGQYSCNCADNKGAFQEKDIDYTDWEDYPH